MRCKKNAIISIIISLILIVGISSIKIEGSLSPNTKETSSKSTQTAQLPKQAENKSADTNTNKSDNNDKTSVTNETTAAKQVDEAKTEPAQTTQPATQSRTTTTVSRGASRTLYLVATGYTDAPEENYPYAGQPSYIGLPLARGIAAVDPDVIPMGSKLYVEGYGEAIAADQGGAIKGNRIDLFFDSKSEAYNWGMRTVRVTVYQ